MSKISRSTQVVRSDSRERALDRYIEHLKSSEIKNSNKPRRNVITYNQDNNSAVPLIVSGNTGLSLNEVFPETRIRKSKRP